MLAALAGALLAGALTTLAPCSLSLLPIVVGGSLRGAAGGSGDPVHGAARGRARRWRPRSAGTRRALAVSAGLAVSVIGFTLALKASTALIGVPASAWRWLSGGLLIVLGLFALFPNLWDRISYAARLGSRSGTALHRASGRDGTAGALLTGAALGPVFSSCSPLYGYVVVTVLPAEPARGLALLAAYVVGLVAVLLVVALLGQRAITRLRWAADPHARWRRALGLVFVVIGGLIATGLMLQVETWLVQHSAIRPWELIGAR